MNKPQFSQFQFQPIEEVNCNEENVQLSNDQMDFQKDQLKFIRTYIDEAKSFIQVKQYNEGIQKFDIILKQSFQILSSEVFQLLLQQIIKFLIQESIDNLNRDEIQISKKILQKCNQWLQSSKFGFFPEMEAIILNHFGCIERRQKNDQQAFLLFDRALTLLQANNKKEYLGETYLNMSAVYAQIQNNTKAIELAKKALIECQKQFSMMKQNTKSQQFQFLEIDDYSSQVRSIAFCYYNIALQEENLGNKEDAFINYQNAYQILKQHLGYYNQITEKFKIAFKQYKERYYKKIIMEQSGKSPINGINQVKQYQQQQPEQLNSAKTSQQIYTKLRKLNFQSQSFRNLFNHNKTNSNIGAAQQISTQESPKRGTFNNISNGRNPKKIIRTFSCNEKTFTTILKQKSISKFDSNINLKKPMHIQTEQDCDWNNMDDTPKQNIFINSLKNSNNGVTKKQHFFQKVYQNKSQNQDLMNYLKKKQIDFSPVNKRTNQEQKGITFFNNNTASSILLQKKLNSNHSSQNQKNIFNSQIIKQNNQQQIHSPTASEIRKINQSQIYIAFDEQKIIYSISQAKLKGTDATDQSDIRGSLIFYLDEDKQLFKAKFTCQSEFIKFQYVYYHYFQVSELYDYLVKNKIESSKIYDILIQLSKQVQPHLKINKQQNCLTIEKLNNVKQNINSDNNTATNSNTYVHDLRQTSLNNKITDDQNCFVIIINNVVNILKQDIIGSHFSRIVFNNTAHQDFEEPSEDNIQPLVAKVSIPNKNEKDVQILPVQRQQQQIEQTQEKQLNKVKPEPIKRLSSIEEDIFNLKELEPILIVSKQQLLQQFDNNETENFESLQKLEPLVSAIQQIEEHPKQYKDVNSEPIRNKQHHHQHHHANQQEQQNNQNKINQTNKDISEDQQHQQQKNQQVANIENKQFQVEKFKQNSYQIIIQEADDKQIENLPIFEYLQYNKLSNNQVVEPSQSQKAENKYPKIKLTTNKRPSIINTEQQ